MKARLAAVIAIVLFVSLGFAPAHAAAKAGLVCKKIGITEVVGAFKYTCIKSGKKIVWNKGVKVPSTKPTPMASPVASPVSSPTPTRTATPTPTPTSTRTATPTPTPTPTQSGLKTFTKADVALHNIETDCWTYVDNKIYDLSKWLPEHPGGAALVLVMCGVDGAAAFRDHHRSEQDNALTIYYIGDLR